MIHYIHINTTAKKDYRPYLVWHCFKKITPLNYINTLPYYNVRQESLTCLCVSHVSRQENILNVKVTWKQFLSDCPECINTFIFCMSLGCKKASVVFIQYCSSAPCLLHMCNTAYIPCIRFHTSIILYWDSSAHGIHISYRLTYRFMNNVSARNDTYFKMVLGALYQGVGKLCAKNNTKPRVLFS